MIRKLTLAVGFGAGYILGAKAGTQRYDQIVGQFRSLAGLSAVQDVKSNLADTATQIGDKAKTAVNEKVSAVGDKVTGTSETGTSDEVVDLSTRTAAAPMPGAAPSMTAPEV